MRDCLLPYPCGKRSRAEREHGYGLKKRNRLRSKRLLLGKLYNPMNLNQIIDAENMIDRLNWNNLIAEIMLISEDETLVSALDNSPHSRQSYPALPLSEILVPRIDAIHNRHQEIAELTERACQSKA